MTTKTAVIGDIHGCVTQLRFALDYSLRVADTTVLVGDYVNRGVASRQVLDELCAAREKHGRRIVLLAGNHEVTLLNFLGQPEHNRSFLSHGGLATVKSYGPYKSSAPVEEFRAKFPDDHRRLLESLEDWYEIDGTFISHAGLDPMRPSDRSREAVVCGSHPKLFEDKCSRGMPLLVISGHYPQVGGIPFIGEHFVCVDTGCGTLPNGKLTCFTFPNPSFEQF